MIAAAIAIMMTAPIAAVSSIAGARLARERTAVHRGCERPKQCNAERTTELRGDLRDPGRGASAFRLHRAHDEVDTLLEARHLARVA